MSEPPIYNYVLSDGNQIIAEELYSDSYATYKLNKPHLLEETQAQDGSTIYTLNPYVLFTTDQPIEIDKAKVVIKAETTDEMKRYYVTSIAYNERFIHERIKKALTLVNNSMERIINAPQTAHKNAKELQLLMMQSPSNLHH